MTTKQIKDKSQRVFSVVLIYALLIQQIVPYGFASANIPITYKIYSDTSISDVDVQNQKEISNDIQVLNNAMEGLELSEEIRIPMDVKMNTMVMAPTGNGGGQTESSGFSLNSTDDLVDKFTGDFTYSIPLMDVEGYPITISYSSNVGMHTEASWVGLGWNLNVGSVSREMRGLPDEFNGEQKIEKTINQKLNKTTDGIKLGTRVSAVSPQLSLTLLGGRYVNSYQGVGKTFDFNANLQMTKSISDNFYLNPSFSFGFNVDTKNGIGRNTSIGLKSADQANMNTFGPTYGRSFNSRAGLTNQTLSLGARGTLRGDNIGASGSVGVSSSFQYGSLTTTPAANFNSISESNYNSFEGFVEFKVFGVGVRTSALADLYNSESGLTYDEPTVDQKFDHPAYGYLHSGKRPNDLPTDNIYPLMDFNRVNDFGYSEEMKNLPFSFQTYDIFRVNGGGISGTFRARRLDIGTYMDPEINSNQIGNKNDFTAGVNPAAAQVTLGYSKGSQDGSSSSGTWDTNLNFIENQAGDNFDQAVYFKALGEMTPEDIDAFNTLGGYSPAYFDVNEVGNDIVLTDYLKVGNSGSNINGSGINLMTESPTIATVFNPIIALNYSSTNFENFVDGTFAPPSVGAVGRIADHREENHISGMSVIKTNGMEYVYGIPTYIIESNEVRFAVEGDSFDPTINLVRYDSGDNSISNNKGRSNYFEKTKTPAYPHAFLLTELKSADYVDVDNNGLSPDDIGTYYKFNYTQLYGPNSQSSESFNFRFPISDNSGNQASYNRGFEGTELDNTASYSYGSKEVWYTHSVEGKNLVAEFYLDDREDAYGVVDENGQIDTSKPLKSLKEIKLFIKSEREDPVNGANAKPIQIVTFEYDYSLCKNTPSNKNTNVTPNYSESGKLTLKAIRIYSGNSKEAALNNYSFDYSEFNPDFNYAEVDGWGNYKEYNAQKPGHIFPYADQDETSADLASEAWKLVSVHTPTNGEIQVSYAADRYVSVQNKRTMKHFDVHKMTNLIEFLHIQNQTSWNGLDNVYNEFRKDFGGYLGMKNFFTNNGYVAPWSFDELYDASVLAVSFTKYNEKFGKFKPDFVPNNVIVFKLQDGIDGALSKTVASSKVKEEYFATGNSGNDYLDELFFKMHVVVKQENGEEILEYVPAFADISDDYIDPFGALLPFEDDFSSIGVMPPTTPGGAYEYGYVILDPLNSGSRERKNDEGDDKNGILLNPLQRHALDYVRQNLPDKVYGSCDGCDPNLSADAVTFFGGDMYKYLIQSGGYVRSFLNDHSTLRLHIPDNIKIGGDSRVKSIKFVDNWNVISEEGGANEQTSTYTWTYKYPSRFEESGVASYEPASIKDESPFYYWDTYVNLKKKFPDQRKFTPIPAQDALFPTPTVGYADVRISFVGIDGYSQSNFITAKDYPTYFNQTDIERSIDKDWSPWMSNEYYGYTQGYIIETNDFHGKPLRSATYRDFGGVTALQFETKYEYSGLRSDVQVIDRSGMVDDEMVSLEFDIHEDSRYKLSNSKGITIGGLLKFKIPTFVPFLIIPIFNYTERNSGFYSNTLVKHINRSAILESVTTTNLNSTNSAKNMLYDRFTGKVLLSTLLDEYNDELYSLSYPAHWYENELRDITSVKGASYNVSISASQMDISGISDEPFTPGDILLVSNGTNSSSAVILSIDNSNVTLINPNGGLYSGITGSVSAQIVNTGRQNRTEELMQRVTTKRSITPVSGSLLIFPTEEIIASSALNYRNKTNLKCRFGEGDFGDNNEVVAGSVVNPFNYGMMGNIVMDSQFKWKSERVHNTSNHGVRFDGYYSSFIPFYELDAFGNWNAITDNDHSSYDGTFNKWRKMGAITRYDEFGRPVEEENQIDIYTSVLYGFNKEYSFYQVAEALNARQRDIAFDGFEDYNYFNNQPLNYQETHFDFRNTLSANVRISEIEKHSGFASLVIDPGFEATVTKGVSTTCFENDDAIIPNENNIEPITAEECYCVQPFKPTEGEYIIGAWIKLGDNASNLDYSDAKVNVTISGGAIYQFSSSGPIIDGWQRVEGVFSISSTASGITVTLHNGSLEDFMYIDDIRIHPFNAKMTTLVYDPETLLPVATHDSYNYTTFYNYDESLQLVRSRKETSEGIQTISETEFASKKNYDN